MTTSRYFTGDSTHKVDAKGRVSLPVGFRKVLEKFGSSEVVILPRMQNPDAHMGLTEAGYEKVIAQVEGMGLKREEAQMLKFRVMAGAKQIAVDDVGRMVLSKELRDQIGIEGEARFVGLGSMFQIWEPSRCAAYEAATRDRVDELVDRIDFGGLHE